MTFIFILSIAMDILSFNLGYYAYQVWHYGIPEEA